MIEDGRTGRLFRAGNRDDLVSVLDSLLSDRSSWEAILEAARSYVESERTWKNSVSRYRSVYESLVRA